MTATIPVNLVATEGVAPITVSTPGLASSNSVDFPVLAAAPTISSISPTSAIAGGPAFTLTVNGDGYIPASQVTGLPGATTTYVSQNQLTVSVPASAIANVGSYALQVVNPGSLHSAQAVFTVKAPTPASIASFSPASARARRAAFIPDRRWRAFSANSVVQVERCTARHHVRQRVGS